jgi:hypothetical protein
MSLIGVSRPEHTPFPYDPTGSVSPRHLNVRVQVSIEGLSHVFLKGGDTLPHISLVSFEFCREAQGFVGKHGIGFRKNGIGLVPSFVPAPGLDAKSRNGHATPMRRDNQIHSECTILPAALDHVTGLNEKV